MLGDMSIVSKLHASPLVILCKERKEIVKAAKYSRYDFATSFEVYLDSLSELGNALNQYVDQEFIFLDDSSAHFNFSFSNTDSDSESSLHNNDFHSEEEEEPTSLHHHDSPEVKDNNSELSFENTTSEVPFDFSSNNHSQHENSPPKMETSSGHRFFPQQVNHDSYGTSMHGTEQNNAATVPPHHENSPKMGTSSGHWFIPQQVNKDSFGAPMHGTEQKNNDATVPSPPPPQVSSWDFLYPISKNYDIHYDHNDQVETEREIREGEGIPDLEDVDEAESDRSSTVSVEELGSGMKCGASSGSSHVSGESSKEEFMAWREIIEENIKSNLEPKITPVQNSESLGNRSSVATPVSSCRVSLKEAILDIKNEFKFLFECGSEFSSVIEAGKVPYHSVNSKLKGKFFGLILAKFMDEFFSLLVLVN